MPIIQYSYNGDVVNGVPHGNGKFNYNTGDWYSGECKFGRPDGFGVYNGANSQYTGYMLSGKFNGTGTLIQGHIISKGEWRDDKQYGIFIKTDKIRYVSYEELYDNGQLIKSNEIQYVDPTVLIVTNKRNRRKYKPQRSFNNEKNKCIGCVHNNVNSVNSICGHVVMCYDCMIKCSACPICRSPIGRIIKLYIS